MNQDSFKNRRLAESIAAILADGIGANDAVSHFIETTFTGSAIKDLPRLLADTENAEVETLYHLLFYPDKTIQMTIEPLLEEAEYTKKDVDEVIAALTRTPLRVRLQIPETSGDPAVRELAIEAPASALEAMIRRLNITRRIEPRVAAALSRLPARRSDILGARILLRNARFPFFKPATDFLCAVIEKTADMPEFFPEALAFITDLLNETDAQTDIYSALMQKKRFFREMIRKALATEKALQKNPPEVMLMRGEPLVCIDIDQARNRMALIDRICLMVYGRTDLTLSSDPEPATLTLRRPPGEKG